MTPFNAPAIREWSAMMNIVIKTTAEVMTALKLGHEIVPVGGGWSARRVGGLTRINPGYGDGEFATGNGLTYLASVLRHWRENPDPRWCGFWVVHREKSGEWSFIAS